MKRWLGQFLFQQLSYELSFVERLSKCIFGGGILLNMNVSAVYFPKCEMVKIITLGRASTIYQKYDFLLPHY
jgi:hypothetical protein